MESHELIMNLLNFLLNRRSSERVAEAAYDNLWYEKNVDLEFKKCLLQVMVTAQKPQCITAYKFMKMSLITCSVVSLVD